jgi:hypothetical protein
MSLSTAQATMLRDLDDGDPTDYADFFLRSGSSALGWRNRERVLSALIRKELVDDDLKLTDAGKAML